MKLLSVIGTRPQFIKLYPLLKRSQAMHIPHVVVNTGQHYDYELDQVFVDEFRMPRPKYNLNIRSGTHAEQIAKILLRLTPILKNEKPDVVIVYGDTNSTLGAGLCAAKLQLPVAHVEAGPRAYNPAIVEELNRVLVDHLSQFLFAPSKDAVKNLKKEGLRGLYVGNIAIENLLSRHRKITPEALRGFKLKPYSYVLITIHHDINTDRKQRLAQIVHALLAYKNSVVFPLHPRTLKQLKAFGLYSKLRAAPHICLLPPVGYTTMLALEKYCKNVVTDSGGVQFESYIQGIPTLLVSDSNEWPETTKSGICKMVRPSQLLAKLNAKIPSRMKNKGAPFHSKVSERILVILGKSLTKRVLL